MWGREAGTWSSALVSTLAQGLGHPLLLNQSGWMGVLVRGPGQRALPGDVWL